MFGHCGNSLLEAEADSSCVSSSNFSAVICGAEFYSGGAALAGSASAATRGMRVDIAVATKSKNAPRYQGAPGTVHSLFGSMKKANVNVNNPGPSIIAIARRLLIAPCNSPCSDSLTRCVIIPFAAGLEMFQIEMIGIDPR